MRSCKTRLHRRKKKNKNSKKAVFTRQKLYNKFLQEHIFPLKETRFKALRESLKRAFYVFIEVLQVIDLQNS